ncbi:MAG TPA: carboxypeptidase regulatory-like domain-containing protein [Candidatus Polarisedimenticolia bacterium]|nr:carboxypeptidase regulatory-like domain-containing protein [Candidatus Polarisedimenticolia bacterium]
MNSKRWLCLAVMSCLVLLSTANLFGQATATASLQGTITDKSQAVIGNKAEVTITNKETGATRTANTNDAGEYRFDSLSAGVYSLKATAPGFSSAETKNLELLVGRTSTQNFTLLPGAVSETVEVTSTAPLVDQTKTDVSTNITPEQVTELPLIGRDIADLAYLSPGVKAADSYDPTKNRYSILSVNGQGGRNVNVTVNGIDNKDNTVGGPVMQLPAEAVQEFAISTQRFSAVNGRSEGAAINVITKSGSNNYHGSAFGFFRDQVLNADQKLADPTVPSGFVTSNPPYSRQWFGGSIGGPIKKDKLFVFFAFERQREHTSIAEAPTALTQLNLVTSLGAQPASVVPTPFFENRINGRMDYTFNSRHSAYLSVTTQANNSLNDQSNGTFDLTEGNFTVNHMQVANLTVNSALSSTLVNSFTAGFSYWNNLIDSTTRAPLVTFPTAQFGTNTNVPQQSFQTKFQFKDDVTKSVGRHTFKTGVDYIWNPKMGGFFEFNPTLEIDFKKNPSCMLGVAPDAATAGCGAAAFPNGFATPGAVKGMTIANGDPSFILPNGTKQLGLYFQDDWKMMKRLTVNVGLRYDRDFNMITGVDATQSRTYQELLALAPINATAARLTRKTAADDTKDFSPRIGFAYDMKGNGNHIFRGGYGLYYGNTFQNIPLFMQQQVNNTVFQTLFSLAPSDTVPGTAILLSNWRFGVDPMPTIAAPSHNLTVGSTGRIMDPDYRSPVTEEFNGGYSWSLSPKSVLEVEYVHVLSLHENKTINVDAKVPIDPNNVALGLIRPMDAAFATAGQTRLGSVRDEQSIGRSRYDGMNISYRQRSFHKIDLSVNYTLARAVGYNEDGGSFRYYPRDPNRPFAPEDFGPAFNDERHHLTISGIWNLPWGMSFAPVLQAGSARPYNELSAVNDLGMGGGSAAQAMLAPGCTLQGYYSRACGLNPMNNKRGDPYFNVDTRLAKNIKLGETRKLQLAFQAFNLFNHANYGNNFDATVGDATFGKPIGFINPTSTVAPRSFTAEFGARFSF